MVSRTFKPLDSDMDSSFILFGTEGCHLCEDAQSLLENIKCTYQPIDIMTDETLLSLYGIRIPVLLHQVTKSTLNWPFDEATLLAFIAENNSRHIAS
jgi:Glutaredoxin-like domain (DUF836)